jgi:hypothetical protein
MNEMLLFTVILCFLNLILNIYLVFFSKEKASPADVHNIPDIIKTKKGLFKARSKRKPKVKSDLEAWKAEQELIDREEGSVL